MEMKRKKRKKNEKRGDAVSCPQAPVVLTTSFGGGGRVSCSQAPVSNVSLSEINKFMY
jgi:hypothetical protein